METVDVVKASFRTENAGTKDDPYIINCNRNTKVSKGFLERIRTTGTYAELCVYDDNSNFIYKWIVNRETIGKKASAEWTVSQGITEDKEKGTLSLDTSVEQFGRFSIVISTGADSSDDSADGSDKTDDIDNGGDVDIPDDGDLDDNDAGTDVTPADPSQTGNTSSGSEDYMYSRAEIKKMISEKEDEIKKLKLDLKSAKLDYNNALKKKTDGKVVATIDGVVKKIGTVGDAAAGGDNSDDVDGKDDKDITDSSTDYSGGSSDDDAFAIIEGEGGVSVTFSVGELNLDKAAVGNTVKVNSYNTGMSIDAEITNISGEPASYSASNWGDNPNSSTYTVEAKLSDSTDFNVGDWVGVSFVSDTTASDSVYLPIHYVRQENGNYYIMKADKDGRLVKSYIKTGKIMYGTNIEVKGGLSMKDKICFPYGKDVKEGVRTKETDKVLYPEY